jgi:hypothetical protein
VSTLLSPDSNGCLPLRVVLAQQTMDLPTRSLPRGEAAFVAGAQEQQGRWLPFPVASVKDKAPLEALFVVGVAMAFRRARRGAVSGGRRVGRLLAAARRRGIGRPNILRTTRKRTGGRPLMQLDGAGWHGIRDYRKQVVYDLLLRHFQLG